MQTKFILLQCYLTKKSRAQGWEYKIFYDSKMILESLKKQHVQLMYGSSMKILLKVKKPNKNPPAPLTL